MDEKSLTNMTEQAFKNVNNRRHRKGGKLCVVITAIVLMAFAIVASVTAVVIITLKNNAPQLNATLPEPLSQEYVPWEGYQGRWDLIDSENMDGYLTEFHIPWLIRQIAGKITLHCDYRVLNGDKLGVQPFNAFLTEDETVYLVNGPETRFYLLQRWHRVNTTWEDGALMMYISASEDGGTVKAQTITRRLLKNNTEMHQTMEIGTTVTKHIYAKAMDDNERRV